MGNNPSLYRTLGKNQFETDSVVVITDASSGMGRELALRYAKRGCKVVAAARRIERLQELVQLAGGSPGSILPVQTDVSVEEDAKNLITKTIETYGKIDLLVLAAGISAHSLFEDFESMEPFRKVVETNLYGCVYPTRYALPYLKAGSAKRLSPTRGHIVVFSSFSGEFGLWYRSCYSASKFAVNGFFESLRMELGGALDITTICPITVQTEFREGSLIKST